MVKSTAYYVGHIFSKGAHAYRKSTFLEKLKISVYTLLSLLGRLFVFTRPIFAVSNSNAGEMISKTGVLNVEKSYKRSNHSHLYLPLLVFYLVTDLSIAAVCGAICSPILLFDLIEKKMKVDEVTEFLQYADQIRLYFMIALGAIAFIVAIVMICRFAPANYIARTSRAHDVSDVMHNTCEATHKKAKWAYFMVVAVPTFLTVAYTIIGVLIIGAIFKFTDAMVYPIVVPIVAFLLVLLFMALFPALFIGSITAQYEISRDTTELEVVIIAEKQEDESFVSQEDIYNQ